ncbi:uncharacterized protein LOC116433492 [Nomia melanderi]|uniref:uncharacterized protein LOC116433492 n=1 Tax=Nomia melanderi TaxID=2448451 RepID=UPI0013041F3E|nr:TNF receptor-associated factor 6-like [Nomia melanderi]XP_031847492.1 TNF receptor-associated factor 6-like [Nomia melanderi]
MAPSVLLFLHLSTLYLTWCVVSVASAPKLTFANVNVTTDDEGVTETEQATCRIATEELVASARATVTRVLTGACSAKAIDERLRGLERNLTRELEEIKTILYKLLNKRDSFRRTENNDLRSYEDDKTARYPRQAEIDAFNNTVHRDLNGSSSFFFYYWRIKDFDKKLDSWTVARSERSATFYAAPNEYGMYMKATPRYFPDGTVFMAAGLTRGPHDSLLEWPFSYKIRLEVLDHSEQRLRQDRGSRIWDPATLCLEYFWDRPKLTGEPDNPECVGLSVPRQVFLSKTPFPDGASSRNTRYLWNGGVTVKLTVYL